MDMPSPPPPHIPTPFSLAPHTFTADPQEHPRWATLRLSYIEFTSPQLIALETGKLIRLLSNYQCGLKKVEILKVFYEGYSSSSSARQASLRTCLEKLIQRARVCFAKYQITIEYNKDTKKYFLAQTDHLN